MLITIKMRAMPFNFAIIILLLFSMTLAPEAHANKMTLEELTHEFQPILDRHFVSGQFLQSKEIKELDVKISSQGKFSIATSNTGDFIFHWNIFTPESLEICMDTKQVVLKSPNKDSKKIKENRIQYSEMGEQGQKQLIEMVRLIHFNPKQIYESADAIMAAPLKNSSSKRITLIPKNQKEFMFQQAEIEVNQKGFISQLTITEKSQDQLNIVFSNLESNEDSKNKPTGALSKSFSCP